MRPLYCSLSLLTVWPKGSSLSEGGRFLTACLSSLTLSSKSFCHWNVSRYASKISGEDSTA